MEMPEHKLDRLPTDVLAAGHIDQLQVYRLKWVDLDVLRGLWEITTKITIFPMYPHSDYISVGGGKGENPEEDWQRILDWIKRIDKLQRVPQ